MLTFTSEFVFTTENGNVKQMCYLFLQSRW